MTDLFDRVAKGNKGYNPDQVNRFFERARAAFESTDGSAKQLAPAKIRNVAFELKKNGYETSVVDVALDRLESAFAKRERDLIVQTQGQQAWVNTLASRAQTLYPRLRRPAGEKFADAKGRKYGYAKTEVDALLDRLVAFFNNGTPLTAEELRDVTFTMLKGDKAYDEQVVDAYLSRAIDVLLGAAN